MPQIRLESLPKTNLRVQSETTNTLVRQLTCLLNQINSYSKSNSWIQISSSHSISYYKILKCFLSMDAHLAYTEYQSHWVLWPMETQSPGSSAAACSPPKGANCPKCLYLPVSRNSNVRMGRKNVIIWQNQNIS